MKPGVSEVKNHLRVDSADDDILIGGFIDAAYINAGNYLRRDLAVDYPDALPAPIEVAIVMHVAALYQNREATSAENVAATPLGYLQLLESYRLFPVE